MQRLSIREGWTTVVLTSLIVYIAVWSILQADWADGLEILNWVTLAGLAAGLVVSKWRRLPSAALHLGGLAFGILTMLVAMTAYLPDEIGDRREKLRWLWMAAACPEAMAAMAASPAPAAAATTPASMAAISGSCMRCCASRPRA